MGSRNIFRNRVDHVFQWLSLAYLLLAVFFFCWLIFFAAVRTENFPSKAEV